MTDPIPESGEPPPLSDLHERVVQAWQTSPQRYSTLSAWLPGLITDTETAVQAHQTAAMEGTCEGPNAAPSTCTARCAR